MSFIGDVVKVTKAATTVVKPPVAKTPAAAPAPAPRPNPATTERKPVSPEVQQHKSQEQLLLGSLKLNSVSQPTASVKTFPSGSSPLKGLLQGSQAGAGSSRGVIKPGLSASGTVGAPVSATATGKVEQAPGLLQKAHTGISLAGSVGQVGATALKEETSNPVYSNPLTGSARLTELAGSSIREGVKGIDWGVEKIDENAHRLPTRELRMGAGIVAGTGGFAAATADGIGSLMETGGRLGQGDPETIKSTVNTVKGLGEGYAYVAGKSQEAVGQGLLSVGQRTGSGSLEFLGQNSIEVGRESQSYAGEDTRAVLDQLGNTVVHYDSQADALLNSKGSQLAGSVGLDSIAGILDRRADGHRDKADATRNELTNAIDAAARGRGEEYRNNGDYAISRDVTRAAWEIGTIVFAPESAAGKTDKAVDVANGLERATDLVTGAERLTDGVTEGTRALEAAGQTRRVSQADRFQEPLSLWEELGGGAYKRPVRDAADGSTWLEFRQGEKSQFSRKILDENGDRWNEAISGQNRWRTRQPQGGELNLADALAHEARQGTHRTLDLGGRQVRVMGDATAEQIKNLHTALEQLPPGARSSLPEEIFVNRDLGQILNLESGAKKTNVAGLADGQQIFVDVESLNSLKAARETVYHELGHVVDFKNPGGSLSEAERWLPGRSVSRYGRTNAAENFAEHTRVVLENWEKLNGRSDLRWLLQRDKSLYAELINEFGGNVPAFLAKRLPTA